MPKWLRSRWAALALAVLSFAAALIIAIVM
jgi:hypothetical protein